MLSKKWQVLVLACMVLVGTFYAFDAPAALNIPLQTHLGVAYDEWQYELNLLYSAYSLPNTILPFITGTFIASYGVSSVLILVSGLVMVGQLIFCFGLYQKSFWVLLLGRVVFGIGGESVSVCQSCIVAQWFGSSSQVSFALGLTVSISRFGSVLNSIFSPRIEQHYDVQTAIWVSTAMCFISFVCSVLLVWITTRANTIPYSPIPEHDSGETLLIDDASEGVLHRISSIPHDPIGSTSSLNERSIIRQLLKTLPPEFWMICLLCILLYGTIIPFNNTVSDFLMEKWYPNDTVTAGMELRYSIPDSISTFLVPFSGFYIDNYGHKVTLLLACGIIVSSAHLMLGLTECNPIPSMFALGIAYSVYGAAIWGSIADVARKRAKRKRIGTLGGAYGISTSLYNTSLVFLPMVAAEIRVRSGGFAWVEVFFASLGAMGVAVACFLYHADARNGGVLEKGKRS
ncbi:major facilitator superfamily domain-containing protein [Obelidium mucronatum]|nr:major facilitator superfamily domain-containing protein [Obelidium mucronatum]